MKNKFDEDDLILCEFQPAFENSIYNFSLGEIVYLNCSPNTPLKVIGFTKNYKSIKVKNIDTSVVLYFPPQCLTKKNDRCINKSNTLKTLFYLN